MYLYRRKARDGIMNKAKREIRKLVLNNITQVSHVIQAANLPFIAKSGGSVRNDKDSQ